MKRIAIVGLGQIGGSIVLSLRKQKKSYFIAGIDSSAKRLKLLKPLLDQTSKNWEATSGADLIILCLHYELIIEFLKQADPQLLMLDVCSGKSKIVALANRRKLRFIGGHPMAGNAFAGEKGWREDLFHDAPFFLCRSPKASDKDLHLVRTFVEDLRALPVMVDPGKHDRFVSVTSHFPAFLSGMLKDMGKKVPHDFHGPGYRSMTRLAATNPDLRKTFLDSNGPNIVKTAKQMRDQLDQWIKDLTRRREAARKKT